MPAKRTKQEVGFEIWRNTFLHLVRSDRNMSYNKKMMYLAQLEDMFKNEYIREHVLQAFANLMWDIDNRVQQDVANELRTIQKMIPEIADEGNTNTKKITALLDTLIEEASEVIDYTDGETLVGEFGDELGEDDNTPIPGVKGN